MLTRVAAVVGILTLCAGSSCSQGEPQREPALSPELVALAEEFSAFEASGGAEADFVPSNEAVTYRDGLVLVDAAAATDGQALLTDLRALGLEGGAAYRRMVSGWLPVRAIGQAGELESVQLIRAGQRATGGS